jgi:hypothetical protein
MTSPLRLSDKVRDKRDGSQLPLLAVAPTLTGRQQAVYDLVTSRPDGVTRDEVGALVHSLKEGRWQHPAGERCDFCARDGRAALRAAALKPLLVGRRDGRWYLRGGSLGRRARPCGGVIATSDPDPATNPWADLSDDSLAGVPSGDLAEVTETA